MSTFVQLLQSRKMTLIMSLPVNDPNLCQAAFEAGADVVKVHINVQHRASGTGFGRLQDEAWSINRILATATGPVGIVPGDSSEKVLLDLDMIHDMPFAFYSVYAHHAPTALLRSGRAVMAACDGSYSEPELSGFKAAGAAALEAAIVSGESYGTPLTMRELLRYRRIVEVSGLPVVVPTQKRISPADVPQLMDCGVSGLMIGAIVTGKTKASITEAVQSFRNAIDRA